MKTHHIPLESFKVKSVLKNGDTGKVSLTMKNGELCMFTFVEGLSKKHLNYAYISDKFKLPFRIDTVIKTNSPAFKLKTGNGHVLFLGSFNRGGFGIRRADIFTGKEETTKNDYDNILPLNEYVNLSIVYGSRATWIAFNGQHCYCSNKASYINLIEKNAVPEEFLNGLDFAIVCGEGVELMIKSLTFTEYENDEPDIHREIANMPELSAFEWYVKSLPQEIRKEAVKTDEYLMKNMKTVLKFKKSVDKDGKLTYVSPCGFQYMLNRYGIGETHSIVWDQKIGFVLKQLAETAPDFADRMFANINEQISSRGGEQCQQCASITCPNKKPIAYNGEIKYACGGAVHFKWIPSEFEDVRKIIAAVCEIVKIDGENTY